MKLGILTHYVVLVLMVMASVTGHTALGGNETTSLGNSCSELVRGLAIHLRMEGAAVAAVNKLRIGLSGNILDKNKTPSFLVTLLNSLRVGRLFLSQSQRLSALGVQLSQLKIEDLAPGDAAILNILLQESQLESQGAKALSGDTFWRLQRFLESLALSPIASLRIAREEIIRIKKIELQYLESKDRLSASGTSRRAMRLREILDSRIPHIQEIARSRLVDLGLMKAAEIDEASEEEGRIQEEEGRIQEEARQLIEEYQGLENEDLKDHEIIQVMETRRLLKSKGPDLVKTLKEIRKSTTKDRKASLGLLRLIALDSEQRSAADWQNGFRSLQEKLAQKRLSVGDSDILRLLQVSNLDTQRMDSLTETFVEAHRLTRGMEFLNSREIVDSIIAALRLKGGSEAKLTADEILLILRSPLPDIRSISERAFDKRERTMYASSGVELLASKQDGDGEGGVANLTADIIAYAFIGAAVQQLHRGGNNSTPPW